MNYKKRTAAENSVNNEIIEQYSVNESSLRKKANYATSKRLDTLICVIENPKTLINVAGIIRTANALGVAKIYIVDGNNIMPTKNWQTMRNNKTLITLTVSAIKWTYIKIFDTTLQCIKHLEKNNFISIATSPHDKNGQPSFEIRNTTFNDKKLSIWFGNETNGISDEMLYHSSKCVKIDMFGMIESLNLASCASIVLYEIAQQRRAFSANKLKL